MSPLSLLRFITTHPLNRDHKVRAIIRFAKWQIASRLAPGAIVYDWIDGSRFLVRTGETGLTGNIYTGLHEFSDMAFLLHVLREDDTFVDVGANVGSYTILACSARGANGYAFEPVPSTYGKLVENIRLNHLESEVTCYNTGVGCEQGSITFTSNMDTENHVLASGEQSESTTDVEVATLDEILSIASPALMKIDVEGYETSVLDGASDTLSKPELHSVLMEINGSGKRYGFDESLILETMLDYGFRTYSYNPLDRTLVRPRGKNPFSGNTLFIRDLSFVRERLEKAPNVKIHGRQF